MNDLRQNYFWVKTLESFFLLTIVSCVLAYSSVSVNEAKQMAQNGEALIVDVRYAEYYEEGHIPGALLFPLDNMENLIRQGKQPFSKEDALILYCDCPAEESSLAAASILEHYGFSKIYVMKGGWQAWKDAAFLTAAGKEPGSLSKRKEECKSCEPSPTQPPQTQPPLSKRNPTPFVFAISLLIGAGGVLLLLLYVLWKARK